MKHPTNNQAFLKKFRFAVLATDIAIFTLNDDHLWVRLIRVNRPPHFDGVPGLPGGLLEPTETAEETAARLVSEKAGLAPTKVYLEQLATFSRVNRDPRGRVVAVAELALINWQSLTTKEQADNKEVWWNRIDKLPKLAYDHNEIFTTALERLRSRITYSTLISKLIPETFTLSELEAAYETILSKEIDKRNFRKKIKKLNILKTTNKKRMGTQWRPAELYSFRSTKVVPTEIL